MPFITQGKTNWKFLLTVIVLAIIVGGGVLFWIKTQEISPVELLEVEKPEKVFEDETADWKTYRDELEGFEIKYPKDWYTVPVGVYFDMPKELDGIGLTNMPQEKIEGVIAAERGEGITETQEEVYGLFIRVTFSSIKNWLESNKEMCNLIKAECLEKAIKVGDYDGYQVTATTKIGGTTTSIVLSGNKRVYIIEPLYPSKCRTEECDIFNKIISTFKLNEIKPTISQDVSCEYKKGEYEWRTYDSQGRVTGLVNGKVKQEIPMSTYINGQVTIYFPQDTYYEEEVFCIKEGNYQLEDSRIIDGKETNFKATNIPISVGVTHRYKIDWKALSEGKNGVTLVIDADDDGTFEKTIPISGTEFTCQQFLAQINKP